MRCTIAASMRIGIDLGGTKIEGIAIADTGEERARRRIAAPRGDYGNTLSAVSGLVAGIERDVATPCSVGIGIPGTVSPATGLIKNSNSTWLNGRALADDLSRLLDRPIRFANDANCFALSEATDGAAAGAHIVFGVIVGTGTGGGVVIDRQVLIGANAIGGEWGHNPLPAARGVESPGPPCYCGRSGCIETFLSGPGLERDHSASGGEQRDGAGDCGAGCRRRLAGGCRAGPVRGSDGASARQHHQRHRSRRHRAGRRTVEHRSPVRACAGDSGCRTSSPTASSRASSAQSTATRAASAGRRGCGTNTFRRNRRDRKERRADHEKTFAVSAVSAVPSYRVSVQTSVSAAAAPAASSQSSAFSCRNRSPSVTNAAAARRKRQ